MGLRSNGAVAHTDQNGQFTLAVIAGRPFTQDQAKAYDYVELDKGQIITISVLTITHG